MLTTLLPLVLFAQVGDDVALVKADPDGGAKMSLLVHAPLGLTGAPTAYASDATFYKSSGKRPARFVIGADIDGDEVDEVVVLKQELDRGGRYRLYVHRAPKALDGSAGKVIASTKKKELGSPSTKGEVVSMCAVEVDADGVDQVAVVRQVGDGSQRLEVFPLPQEKKAKLGAPIGSFLDFGLDPFDTVASIDGVDVDADGAEEIVVLRRGTMSPHERILVHRAPLVVGDVPGAPITGAGDPNPSAGEILAIRSFDLQSDGIDEVGIVRETPSGLTRLTVLPLPLFGQFGPPASDVLFVADPEKSATHSLFALRGLSSKGNQDPFDSTELNGEYSVSMNHTEVVGYLGGGSESFGANGTGSLTGEGAFSFDFDDGGDLVGQFIGYAMTIDLAVGGQQAAMKGKDGDQLSLFFGDAKVLWLGSKAILTGTYFGSGVDKNGGSFSVTGGTYQLVREVD
ncbi:MAG: hypothetical protein ACF8XB_25795 [Planctomycetota bacterium JB042]